MEEKDEENIENVKHDSENIETKDNKQKLSSTHKTHKKEIVGPKIKKPKKNKTEDKELQIAFEDAKERKERLKEEKAAKKRNKLKQKEEELKNKNLIFKIDEENYNCVDCGNVKSTFISINNGVTICDICAQQHQLLGHSISYLKNINDQLDEYLFNFIVFGSNSRFKLFIKNEKIDEHLSIKRKYKVKALYFYRKTLKNKVNGIILPLKDYENPNEIVENNIEDDYPEFNKYKIKKQIIEKGEFKKESKIKNLLNKIIKIGGNSKTNNNILILRSKSSITEELKKENVITNEEGDDIDKINIFKKSPPAITYDPDKLKESSRPMNDDKNETEKAEENEETPRVHRTDEPIIKKGKEKA